MRKYLNLNSVIFFLSFPDQVIKSDLAPERRSWFILVQLTQALRYAHKKMRRSLDVLDPTKVLIQDGSR